MPAPRSQGRSVESVERPRLAKEAETRPIAEKGHATAAMTKTASDEERAAWAAELEHLRQEHRDLDAAIEALVHMGSGDRLQVQRLKKRKLALRDRMSFLDDQITPDIIA